MNCAVHNQTQAVAYCRTCGKALCEECKRDVMGAIYCEPCIAARLQGVPGVTAPGATIVPPPPPPPGAPNPVIAGLFGFIPGVGAMYNGQFVKAFAHVVIFVMLIIAADNISDVFGFLIAFFVFYMAFEAYKTAEAKRHGLPTPDPLGLDKMFGIQESQPIHSTSVPSVGNATAYPPVTPPPLQVEPPPPRPQDNVPIGAIVLIGLGVFFLLNNLQILRLRHLGPLFLIGVGLWIVYKRATQPGAGASR
ncbi:MAG TPA: B-box zinc finger protein [Candidatus Angelobacter sp.]